LKIGITSNVANVKGKDPKTPGSLRGSNERWYVGGSFRGYVLLGTLGDPEEAPGP